ncbi:hypothetical protein JB92DRAFT_2918317 [Gautieria morchelliformis]|nr:hypothetical protein JB92DRAFT_2918317 [Gautieria morchelliformis]
MIKLTVWFLLFLDALSTAFDIAMTYQYLVVSFGNPEAIGLINVGITPYPLLTGVTSSAVQAFFAWRISIITGMKWLSLGILILAIIQLLASIGTSIGGNIVHHLASLWKVRPVALIWLIGSAATDLVITTVLVIYLRKKKTGYVATDDIVSRIVRMTVQTGLLTSACALAVMIAYLVSDTSM